MEFGDLRSLAHGDGVPFDVYRKLTPEQQNYVRGVQRNVDWDRRCAVVRAIEERSQSVILALSDREHILCASTEALANVAWWVAADSTIICAVDALGGGELMVGNVLLYKFVGAELGLRWALDVRRDALQLVRHPLRPYLEQVVDDWSRGVAPTREHQLLTSAEWACVSKNATYVLQHAAHAKADHAHPGTSGSFVWRNRANLEIALYLKKWVRFVIEKAKDFV